MTTRETKHTPGTLKVVDGMGAVEAQWVAGKWYEIAKCYGKEDGEIFANAALIARAPDLLADNARLREALQLLHDNLAEYQRINNLGGYDNHDMKMARAALRERV